MLDPPMGFAELSLRGSGATSQVYRAVDRRARRVVALKRLHRQLVRDAEALARLRRELTALNAVRHPGIVAVRDVISWGGQPTIVMDFVEGIDLKERLLGEALPLAETERVARALFDILSAAHAAGIVHRDVKPQNVRIREDGEIVLLDFGSARLEATSALTATGTTVGTPDYMAPELFVGPVYDPRVDIYGVGATIHECLTGRPPIGGDSLAELALQRTSRDSPPVHLARPDCPEHLARVIDRCLARLPADRFSSAARALHALDHPEEERALAARRSSHPPCLGCDTPIAPESEECPVCRRARPFAYEPGVASVDLSEISDPPALLAHIVHQFPERATPEGLASLTAALALTARRPQRYVSQVSEADAERISEALARAGASPRTVRFGRYRPVWSLLAGLVLGWPLFHQGALTGLLAGLVSALVVFLLSTAVRVALAPSSLLGAHRGRLPVASPRLGAGSLVLLVLSLIAGLSTSDPWALAAIAVSSTLAFLTLSTRTRGFDLPRHLSPEPGCGAKLLSALTIDRRLIKNRAEQGTRARVQMSTRSRAGQLSSTLVSLLAVTGIVFLLPAELITLHRIATDPLPGVLRVSGVGSPATPRPAPSSGRTSSPYRSQRAEVAISTPPPPRPFSWGPVTWIALSTGGLLLLARRKRQASQDARLLHEALDLERVIPRPDRRAPSTRRGAVRTRDPRLGRLMESVPKEADGFTCFALERAIDLAATASLDENEQMRLLLTELARSRADARHAERSLRARCILETDQGQRLKLDFLLLAGELEARAGAAWAKTLRRPEAR